MSALTEALTQASQLNPNAKKSALEAAIEKMNETDRKAVIVALENKNVTAVALARILTDNGHKVGEQIIRRIRNGDSSTSIQNLKDKYL